MAWHRFRSNEAKASILEEVLELAADEEIQVREAALDCLLNMTHLFDDGKLFCLILEQLLTAILKTAG